ncbi:TonB-dependent receptor [Neolewinella lacunae]|uniref:TonB-dependent receptor n=2 Tax=Neolewinella lacunae TaxID=1517758 RepID=A0A923PQD0_9BACT|nr:TonB-dependent receptor [Neolewinella lacunae]MDN3634816.1 TonB-dependent receptor [Neolewinella lacunae]
MLLIQLRKRGFQQWIYPRKMLLLLCAIAFAASAHQLSAQADLENSAAGKTVIYGKVHDKKGEPLIGVSLQVEGTYDGTITEFDGSFQFSTEAQGSARLIVSMFGFQNVEQDIVLSGNDSLSFDISFGKETLNLEEVVVSDVRQVQTTDKARATQLNRVEALTTAVDGNVQSAFQTMAGVQPTALAGGLFIRGGAGRESQAFVDGMLVDDFNYSSPSNTAGSARFSANMFKGSFLSTGGFSAKYGQAISGALILETTDVPLKSSADIGLSPLFAEAGFEKVNQKKNFSYGATGKYQNLGIFLRLMPTSMQFTEYPLTYEGTANFKWRPKEGTQVKTFASYGDSRLGLFNQDLDEASVLEHTKLRNRNLFWQSTFSHDLSNRWSLSGGAGYGRRQTDVNQFASNDEMTPLGEIFEVDEANTLSQARVNLSHRKKGQTLDVGAEVQHRSDVIQAGGISGTLNDTYGAAYAEKAGVLFGRLQGRAGLRLENSQLLEETTLSPRVNLNYLLGRDEQIFAGWGSFNQRPDTRQLYQENGQLNFERAQHYTLGYNRSTNKRSFRAEMYWKEYDKLVLFDTDLESARYANTGNGFARGLDVFYRDKTLHKGTDFWLTYSFVDAERRYAHFPIAAQPNFVANHVGNIVVKHFFQKQMVNLGMTYTMASGRPYFNPNRPVEEFHSDKTPAFHNVNFNIAYLPKTKKAFTVIVLTLYNAFNFNQTLNYEYSPTNFDVRRGVGPLTERYVFLGFFANFGIDRTDDIINQQLN